MSRNAKQIALFFALIFAIVGAGATIAAFPQQTFVVGLGLCAATVVGIFLVALWKLAGSIVK